MQKLNFYLILLGITTICVFGTIFIVQYVRTGEMLIDPILGTILGIALLTVSLIWRKRYKKQT